MIEAKAAVEGDEVVIRVPIEMLPHAIHVDGFKVIDGAKFAADLVIALNAQDEIGDTAVHRMLDECAVEAIEDGAEGVEEVAEDDGADR